MSDDDWVATTFPGEGLEYPTDVERDYADNLLKEWCEKWGEPVVTIPRTHPTESEEGMANYLAGMPTNRAYLRSKLRRWWRKP